MSTQKHLFGDFDAQVMTQPVATEQQRQLDRVEKNLAEFVMDFLYQVRRGPDGKVFRMSELQAFVAERHKSAPASPDRILRSLKEQGRVQYTVVSRSQSMYRVDSLEN